MFMMSTKTSSIIEKFQPPGTSVQVLGIDYYDKYTKMYLFLESLVLYFQSMVDTECIGMSCIKPSTTNTK